MGENRKVVLQLWFQWRQLDAAGRYEEAIDVADRMLDLAKDEEDGRSFAEHGRRVSESNLCRLREIEDRFHRAVSEGSGADQAWVERGEALLELARYDGASQSFTEALALNRASVAAWIGLGVARLEKDPAIAAEEVLDCFDQAIALNPASEDAWLQKGFFLSDRYRQREALECFDRIIEQINPLNPWAWYAKGLELASERRDETAPACFVKGLQLDPDPASAWSCHEVRIQANS
jgi:tetratricopeptide (TPR) repeat protein